MPALRTITKNLHRAMVSNTYEAMETRDRNMQPMPTMPSETLSFRFVSSCTTHYIELNKTTKAKIVQRMKAQFCFRARILLLLSKVTSSETISLKSCTISYILIPKSQIALKKVRDSAKKKIVSRSYRSKTSRNSRNRIVANNPLNRQSRAMKNGSLLMQALPRMTQDTIIIMRTKKTSICTPLHTKAFMTYFF